MSSSLKKAFFLTLLAMGLLAGAGIISRANHLEDLKRQARETSVQQVIVFSPLSESPESILALPGDVVAYKDASIYARSPGYIRKWYADIGTEVKKGDLIATIATPEIDAQVSQARSDLSTAKANYDLARITLDRWKVLVKTRTVSEQDLQNKIGDEAAKKSVLDSAKARLDQLLALQSFEEIRAPFSGTVSARNVDIGDLVEAGPSGRELFHVVDRKKLRIYVQVPQPQADEIRPGMKAEMTLPEYPGRRFKVDVIENAGALDPKSRTVQVELLYDNSANQVNPGDYADISFKANAALPRTIIPITALLFRGDGLQVAAVENGRIHLVKVVPGRDYGKRMEILSGIESHATVVDNPPDSIMEGQQVAVASVRKLKAGQ